MYDFTALFHAAYGLESLINKNRERAERERRPLDATERRLLAFWLEALTCLYEIGAGPAYEKFYRARLEIQKGRD